MQCHRDARTTTHSGETLCQGATSPTTGPQQRRIPYAVSGGVNDHKIRQALRGLVRAERTPKAQSLQVEGPRQPLPEANERSQRESQTGEPYQSAQAIARAWAEAGGNKNLRQAAAQLGEALAGLKGRIPGACIAQLVSGWKRDLSRWTVLNKTIALRKILRAIDRELRTNLEEAVPRIDKPTPRNVTITDVELARMLEIATPDMRLFVLLMSVMALRFEEAHHVGPEHYDDATQTIKMETKGHRLKELPVPEIIAAIFRLAPDREGSYIERLHGHRMCPNWLRVRWNRLKKAAGVRPEVIPHDLRRTAAIRVYTLTKDVFASKELLAHDSLASTAHYLSAHAPAAMRGVRKALMEWTPPKGERKQ